MQDRTGRQRGYQIAAKFTNHHDPFELWDGPHLFCDLRFIECGSPAYYDDSGAQVGLKDTGPVRACHSRPKDVPCGIRLVAEKPVKSEPLEGKVGATVIYDAGLYRSWDGANYFESQDGFVWERPEIPGEEDVEDRNSLFFPGHPPHGPGVFIDPSSPDDERYKMVYMGDGGPGDERFKHYLETRPDDVDPLLARRGALAAVLGAVSPDGLRWKMVEDPLVITMADNPNTCYYDTRLGKYVLYTRCAAGWGRRCVGRSESDTFSNFPLPELNLWADMTYLPSDDFYTNAHSLYPGTLDHQFMFPTVYNRGTDACWVDIYAGADGIHWNRIPGGPIVEGSHDDHDAGCLFTLGGGLVPLAADRVGVAFSGSSFPHKYPRWPDRGDQGMPRYAMWKTGRIACVQAQEEGFFATPALKFSGRELKLNFSTPMTGDIRVEAVAIKSWVRKSKQEEIISGRSFEDCDPLSGDSLSRTVTWKGSSDIGHSEGQCVYFRFRLRYAKLYAFEIA